MKIELSEHQIDAVTKAQLSALQKEVRSLRAKLEKRDRTIELLRGNMDVTAEARQKVRELCLTLVDVLQAKGWANYPEDC